MIENTMKETFKRSRSTANRRLCLKSTSIAVAGLLLVLSGCSTPSPPTSPATLTTQDLTLLSGRPGDQSPSPTLTALPPSSGCPVELGAPDLPVLSIPSDWPVNVLSYLNQGGSLSGLIEALPGLEQDDPGGLAAAKEDLNGDSYDDFAITLAEQAPAMEGQHAGQSTLLIFLCDLDTFRLAHAASSKPEADRFHLHQIIDVTGDGVKELLVMQELCGAHTCFQAWEILQWQTNEFVNILQGRSDDLPSPTLALHGPREDGSMVVEITAGGIQSAGAGPARAITREWLWSNADSLFIIFGERLAPASFRIHLLHDADEAARTGNFTEALNGYMRVSEDPSLRDDTFQEQGPTQLSAYALYRTMLLYLNEGMLDQASEAHTFLQEAHPQGSLAEGYAKLADEVWQSYLAQPDLGRACQIAQAYANQHPETVLDPLYYGYANKIYTAVDICPYTD